MSDVCSCGERIADEAIILRGLRRRIHVLEAHNQHFERCESLWCNPNGTLSSGPAGDYNPAYETGKQDVWYGDAACQSANKRIAELELALKWKTVELEVRANGPAMSTKERWDYNRYPSWADGWLGVIKTLKGRYYAAGHAAVEAKIAERMKGE